MLDSLPPSVRLPGGSAYAEHQLHPPDPVDPLAGAGALAPRPPSAPPTPPVHVVDLMTPERAAVFGAAWRRARLPVRGDRPQVRIPATIAAACTQAGLRPIRTRPYMPRTSGKAERLVQTSLRE